MEVQLGWNRQQIALKLDRDEIWISDHLKMLQLEPFVSPAVLTKLTVKQTKAILKAPEGLILDLVGEIEQRFNEDGYIMSSKTIQEYIEYLEAKGTTPESIEEGFSSCFIA